MIGVGICCAVQSQRSGELSLDNNYYHDPGSGPEPAKGETLEGIPFFPSGLVDQAASQLVGPCANRTSSVY